MPIVNFDLNTYKTRFTGGARPYLFYVFIQFPASTKNQMKGSGGASNYSDGWQKWLLPAAESVLTTYGLGSATDKWPYLVKSTNLPEITIDEIVIPWQHLDYKIAGITRYGDWTVTFYIDEQYTLLEKLAAWQQMVHGSANSNDYGDTWLQTHHDVNSFRQDQEVHLIDYSGNIVMSYVLKKVWPKSIGAISLDYSASDILSVDVTFSVQSISYDYKPDTAVSDILKRSYEKAINYIRG